MNTREIVSEPVHFAAMMVLYGQADAIVAGNMKRVASVFRAVNKYRQEPVPTKPLFAISIVLVPEFAKKFGGRGIYFLADTGVTPDPTVENMAYFAVETAKMARAHARQKRSRRHVERLHRRGPCRNWLRTAPGPLPRWPGAWCRRTA